MVWVKIKDWSYGNALLQKVLNLMLFQTERNRTVNNYLRTGNDYIGKMLTVVFQGYTRDCSLRFAKGKDIRFDI